MRNNNVNEVKEIVNDLICRVRDERGVVIDSMYNTLFDQEGYLVENEVRRLENSAKSLYEFYLDVYQDKDIRTCLQYAKEDFFNFVWASQVDRLDRNRELREGDVDWHFFNDIWAQREKVLGDIADWSAVRRGQYNATYPQTQNRGWGTPTQQANRPYSNRPQQSFSAYGDNPPHQTSNSPFKNNSVFGHQNRVVANNDTGVVGLRYTYSQNNAHSSNRNQAGVSAYANLNVNTPQPQQTQHQDTTSWYDTTNANTQVSRPVSNVSGFNQPYGSPNSGRNQNTRPQQQSHGYDNYIQQPSEPVVQHKPNVIRYITSESGLDGYRFKVNSKLTGFIPDFDIRTQRLLAMYCDDGYVHFEVLNMDEMALEDHERVIRDIWIDGKIIAANTKVVHVDAGGIDITERSELYSMYQQIFEEWKTEGKLTDADKKVEHWSKASETLADEIAKEAIRRMTEELNLDEKETDTTPLREDVPEWARGLYANKLEKNEEIKMPVVNYDKPILVASYDTARQILQASSVDSVTDRGIRIPFAKQDVFFSTANETLIENTKGLFKTLVRNNDLTAGEQLTQFYNAYVTQKDLSRTLYCLLDKSATDNMNMALVMHDAPFTIQSFREDYVAALKRLDELENDPNSSWTARETTAVLNYTRNKICIISSPTEESLKATHGALTKEQIDLLLKRSVFAAHVGMMVYVPRTSVELQLTRQNNLIKPETNPLIDAVLADAFDEYDEVIIATADNKYFSVSSMKMLGKYFIEEV